MTDCIYGVYVSLAPPIPIETNDLPYPPPAYRRPCHWAQLHAGIQHIIPVWERNALIWQSCGYRVQDIAKVTHHTAPEVRAAIARVTRTLATWEREQDRHATRYPLREPGALWPDGARERDASRRPGKTVSH
jgi:hypothetical protein